MANTAVLNNIDHSDLRVLAHHAPEFGDNVHQCVVFPTEYAEVQREYPIFFQQDQDGGYQSVALLGLSKDENLFLGPQGWEHARYVPAYHQRGPFLIGLNKAAEKDEAESDVQVLVDLDHPRITKDDRGVPVFRAQGGNSPYLEQVIRTLRILYVGNSVSNEMFSAFEAEDLIAPLTIDIHINDRDRTELKNYFGIDRERLASLDGAALERLNKGGYLQAAFLVLASQANVHRLIDLKNRRTQAG